MLGGLMIWGLNPGPMLSIEQRDFVWGMIASMCLGNVVGVLLALAAVPLFAAMLRVPLTTIGPVIAVVRVISAWTVAAAPLGLWLAVAFGAMGWAMRTLDYPLAPLVLAIAMGDKADDAFRQSMPISRGPLGVLRSSPLADMLSTLAVLFLLWPLAAALLARRTAPEVACP